MITNKPHCPRRIVCLCGSTKFWRQFQQSSLVETMNGRIVLSIGAASGTDDAHFGNLPKDEYNRVKQRLDELHLDKISLADEILVLNCGGYIGESTSREIRHALQQHKKIRWLEPEHATANFERVLRDWLADALAEQDQVGKNTQDERCTISRNP